MANIFDKLRVEYLSAKQKQKDDDRKSENEPKDRVVTEDKRKEDIVKSKAAVVMNDSDNNNKYGGNGSVSPTKDAHQTWRLETSFVIPKKKRHNTGLLVDLPIDSREFQLEVLPIITSSFRKPQSVTKFIFKKAQTVHNAELLGSFSEKKKELRQSGYTEKELADSYAFVCVENEADVNKICKNGLSIGNCLNSCLGHPDMGVQLCKHADVVKMTPLHTGFTAYLIVFKIMKGRIKMVVENRSGNYLEPTPNFECHLSNATGSDVESSVQSTYESTQVYLYEYGEENLEQVPRNVCPIAVMQFTIENTRDSKFTDNSRLIQSSSPRTNNGQSPSKEEQYTVWSGSLSVKGLYACNVEMISMATCVKPANIGNRVNISQKLELNEVRRKFFKNVQYIRKKSEGCYNGHYINVCQLQPVETKSRFTFQKIMNYLGKHNCAAVFKVEDDTTLLLLTASELTYQLGLSKCHQYPVLLYCVFISARPCRKFRHIPDHYIDGSDVPYLGNRSKSKSLHVTMPKNPYSNLSNSPNVANSNNRPHEGISADDNQSPVFQRNGVVQSSPQPSYINSSPNLQQSPVPFPNGHFQASPQMGSPMSLGSPMPPPPPPIVNSPQHYCNIPPPVMLPQNNCNLLPPPPPAAVRSPLSPQNNFSVPPPPLPYSPQTICPPPCSPLQTMGYNSPVSMPRPPYSTPPPPLPPMYSTQQFTPPTNSYSSQQFVPSSPEGARVQNISPVLNGGNFNVQPIIPSLPSPNHVPSPQRSGSPVRRSSAEIDRSPAKIINQDGDVTRSECTSIPNGDYPPLPPEPPIPTRIVLPFNSYDGSFQSEPPVTSLLKADKLQKDFDLQIKAVQFQRYALQALKNARNNLFANNGHGENDSNSDMEISDDDLDCVSESGDATDKERMKKYNEIIYDLVDMKKMLDKKLDSSSSTKVEVERMRQILNEDVTPSKEEVEKMRKILGKDYSSYMSRCVQNKKHKKLKRSISDQTTNYHEAEKMRRLLDQNVNCTRIDEIKSSSIDSDVKSATPIKRRKSEPPEKIDNSSKVKLIPLERTNISSSANNGIFDTARDMNQFLNSGLIEDQSGRVKAPSSDANPNVTKKGVVSKHDNVENGNEKLGNVIKEHIKKDEKQKSNKEDNRKENGLSSDKVKSQKKKIGKIQENESSVKTLETTNPSNGKLNGDSKAKSGTKKVEMTNLPNSQRKLDNTCKVKTIMKNSEMSSNKMEVNNKINKTNMTKLEIPISRDPRLQPRVDRGKTLANKDTIPVSKDTKISLGKGEHEKRNTLYGKRKSMSSSSSSSQKENQPNKNKVKSWVQANKEKKLPTAPQFGVCRSDIISMAKIPKKKKTISRGVNNENAGDAAGGKRKQRTKNSSSTHRSNNIPLAVKSSNTDLPHLQTLSDNDGEICTLESDNIHESESEMSSAAGVYDERSGHTERSVDVTDDCMESGKVNKESSAVSLENSYRNSSRSTVGEQKEKYKYSKDIRSGEIISDNSGCEMDNRNKTKSETSYNSGCEIITDSRNKTESSINDKLCSDSASMEESRSCGNHGNQNDVCNQVTSIDDDKMHDSSHNDTNTSSLGEDDFHQSIKIMGDNSVSKEASQMVEKLIIDLTAAKSTTVKMEDSDDDMDYCFDANRKVNAIPGKEDLRITVKNDISLNFHIRAVTKEQIVKSALHGEQYLSSRMCADDISLKNSISCVIHKMDDEFSVSRQVTENAKANQINLKKINKSKANNKPIKDKTFDFDIVNSIIRDSHSIKKKASQPGPIKFESHDPNPINEQQDFQPIKSKYSDLIKTEQDPDPIKSELHYPDPIKSNLKQHDSYPIKSQPNQPKPIKIRYRDPDPIRSKLHDSDSEDFPFDTVPSIMSTSENLYNDLIDPLLRLGGEMEDTENLVENVQLDKNEPMSTEEENRSTVKPSSKTNESKSTVETSQREISSKNTSKPPLKENENKSTVEPSQRENDNKSTVEPSLRENNIKSTFEKPDDIIKVEESENDKNDTRNIVEEVVTHIKEETNSDVPTKPLSDIKTDDTKDIAEESTYKQVSDSEQKLSKNPKIEEGEKSNNKEDEKPNTKENEKPKIKEDEKLMIKETEKPNMKENEKMKVDSDAKTDIGDSEKIKLSGDDEKTISEKPLLIKEKPRVNVGLKGESGKESSKSELSREHAERSTSNHSRESSSHRRSKSSHSKEDTSARKQSEKKSDKLNKPQIDSSRRGKSQSQQNSSKNRKDDQKENKKFEETKSENCKEKKQIKKIDGGILKKIKSYVVKASSDKDRKTKTSKESKSSSSTSKVLSKSEEDKVRSTSSSGGNRVSSKSYEDKSKTTILSNNKTSSSEKNKSKGLSGNNVQTKSSGEKLKISDEKTRMRSISGDKGSSKSSAEKMQTTSLSTAAGNKNLLKSSEEKMKTSEDKTGTTVTGTRDSTAKLSEIETKTTRLSGNTVTFSTTLDGENKRDINIFAQEKDMSTQKEDIQDSTMNGPVRRVMDTNRQGRLYHPYKKKEKKKKRNRKNSWCFDIAYSDLHDLLTDLSASTFRQTQKTTNQTPKPNICERRFSNYKFTRSDVPETGVLCSSSEDENEDFTQDAIPDFEERKKKADMIDSLLVNKDEKAFKVEKSIYGKDTDESEKKSSSKKESIQDKLIRLSRQESSSSIDSDNATPHEGALTSNSDQQSSQDSTLSGGSSKQLTGQDSDNKDIECSKDMSTSDTICTDTNDGGNEVVKTIQETNSDIGKEITSKDNSDEAQGEDSEIEERELLRDSENDQIEMLDPDISDWIIIDEYESDINITQDDKALEPPSGPGPSSSPYTTSNIKYLKQSEMPYSSTNISIDFKNDDMLITPAPSGESNSYLISPVTDVSSTEVRGIAEKDFSVDYTKPSFELLGNDKIKHLKSVSLEENTIGFVTPEVKVIHSYNQSEVKHKGGQSEIKREIDQSEILHGDQLKESIKEEFNKPASEITEVKSYIIQSNVNMEKNLNEHESDFAKEVIIKRNEIEEDNICQVNRDIDSEVVSAKTNTEHVKGEPGSGSVKNIADDCLDPVDADIGLGDLNKLLVKENLENNILDDMGNGNKKEMELLKSPSREVENVMTNKDVTGNEYLKKFGIENVGDIPLPTTTPPPIGDKPESSSLIENVDHLKNVPLPESPMMLNSENLSSQTKPLSFVQTETKHVVCDLSEKYDLDSDKENESEMFNWKNNDRICEQYLEYPINSNYICEQYLEHPVELQSNDNFVGNSENIGSSEHDHGHHHVELESKESFVGNSELLNHDRGEHYVELQTDDNFVGNSENELLDHDHPEHHNKLESNYNFLGNSENIESLNHEHQESHVELQADENFLENSENLESEFLDHDRGDYFMEMYKESVDNYTGVGTCVTVDSTSDKVMSESLVIESCHDNIQNSNNWSAIESATTDEDGRNDKPHEQTDIYKQQSSIVTENKGIENRNIIEQALFQSEINLPVEQNIEEHETCSHQSENIINDNYGPDLTHSSTEGQLQTMNEYTEQIPSVLSHHEQQHNFTMLNEQGEIGSPIISTPPVVGFSHLRGDNSVFTNTSYTDSCIVIPDEQGENKTGWTQNDFVVRKTADICKQGTCHVAIHNHETILTLEQDEILDTLFNQSVDHSGDIIIENIEAHLDTEIDVSKYLSSIEGGEKNKLRGESSASENEHKGGKYLENTCIQSPEKNLVVDSSVVIQTNSHLDSGLQHKSELVVGNVANEMTEIYSSKCLEQREPKDLLLKSPQTYDNCLSEMTGHSEKYYNQLKLLEASNQINSHVSFARSSNPEIEQFENQVGFENGVQPVSDELELKLVSENERATLKRSPDYCLMSEKWTRPPSKEGIQEFVQDSEDTELETETEIESDVESLSSSSSSESVVVIDDTLYAEDNSEEEPDHVVYVKGCNNNGANCDDKQIGSKNGSELDLSGNIPVPVKSDLHVSAYPSCTAVTFSTSESTVKDSSLNIGQNNNKHSSPSVTANKGGVQENKTIQSEAHHNTFSIPVHLSNTVDKKPNKQSQNVHQESINTQNVSFISQAKISANNFTPGVTSNAPVSKVLPVSLVPPHQTSNIPFQHYGIMASLDPLTLVLANSLRQQFQQKILASLNQLRFPRPPFEQPLNIGQSSLFSQPSNLYSHTSPLTGQHTLNMAQSNCIQNPPNFTNLFGGQSLEPSASNFYPPMNNNQQQACNQARFMLPSEQIGFPGYRPRIPMFHTPAGGNNYSDFLLRSCILQRPVLPFSNLFPGSQGGNERPFSSASLEPQDLTKSTGQNHSQFKSHPSSSFLPHSNNPSPLPPMSTFTLRKTSDSQRTQPYSNHIPTSSVQKGLQSQVDNLEKSPGPLNLIVSSSANSSLPHQQKEKGNNKPLIAHVRPIVNPEQRKDELYGLTQDPRCTSTAPSAADIYRTFS